MCGIAGVFELDPRRPVSREVVGSMVDAVRHRGPDDDGFFFADGIGLGMCRLSIIDVAGGKQPLCDESGDVVVMQNGEIYNYRELRAALLRRGHRFATESDTEVIAHLYEDAGTDFARSLNGMFAIALFDRKRRRLVLARDRLGKKPLFVHADGERVVFGSEMKSLLGTKLFRTGVDLGALHDYLSFNFVPPPATIFDAIREVAPGAMLVVEDGAVGEERYWELRVGQERPWDRSRADEFRALFRDAVALRRGRGRDARRLGLARGGAVQHARPVGRGPRAVRGPRRLPPRREDRARARRAAPRRTGPRLRDRRPRPARAGARDGSDLADALRGHDAASAGKQPREGGPHGHGLRPRAALPVPRLSPRRARVHDPRQRPDRERRGETPAARNARAGAAERSLAPQADVRRAASRLVPLERAPAAPPPVGGPAAAAR